MRLSAVMVKAKINNVRINPRSVILRAKPIAAKNDCWPDRIRKRSAIVVLE